VVRDPLPQDWALLGLRAGATLEEVRAAYVRRRSLYDREALATYSLLDTSERTALVDRLDDAYRAIAGAHRVSSDASAVPLPSASEAPPAFQPPAPDREPGAFLRHQREAREVSKERLAAETKIRASMLELIESESFAALPAPVYVRGFVVQCARALKLDDPEGLAEHFLVKMHAAIGESE
jgi:hypothetical protein